MRRIILLYSCDHQALTFPLEVEGDHESIQAELAIPTRQRMVLVVQVQLKRAQGVLDM